jgi:hypothetical protein
MIPHNYEFDGRWQINLKGWDLVLLLAVGTIVSGLTIILGLTIRGLLRGDWGGNLGGFFFPIVLVVFVAFIILHEGVHGLIFLVFGGKAPFRC